MPSKKRSVLPYYIFIQFIVLGFLVLSFMNINKEEKPEEKHYEVINLAREQLDRIDKISDGLLSMLSYEGNEKLSALNLNNALMGSLEENQEKLKGMIDRSKIKENDKKAVNKMYATCLTFMNNFKQAQTYVVEKAGVSSLADSFSNMVKRSEAGYSKKMNDLIAVYQKAENDKLAAQKRQNYMVFGIGLLFMALNIVILVTPARKIIFGSPSAPKS